MFDEVEAAIDGAGIPVAAADVQRLVELLGRFSMLVTVAVGRLDSLRGFEVDGHVALAPWLQDSAGVDPRTARRLAVSARKLAAFPALQCAAAAGTVTAGQVEVVLEGIARHRAAFAAVGAPVVDALAGLSLPDTAAVMAAWRERMDNEQPTRPDDAEASTLTLARHFEGRVAGRFDLDADDGQVVLAALRLADAGDRERSVAERRGDAFATMARTFLAHQDCERPGRATVDVHVVVRPDQLATGTGGRYEDGTPVEHLGAVACDAVLHRLVVDEHGTVLSHGRTERLFTDAQRRIIFLRDGGCRFPGCDRPASWCDTHHIHWWEHGGRTDVNNGVALCRRHHRLVHRAGYQLKLLPDATLRVTYPDGRVRTTAPALRRTLAPPGARAA